MCLILPRFPLFLGRPDVLPLCGPSDHPVVSESLTVCLPAGRASSSPSVDLLITLLSLGADGWKLKLQERKQMYTELQQRLAQLAERHGERLLVTRNNPISIGAYPGTVHCRAMVL